MSEKATHPFIVSTATDDDGNCWHYEMFSPVRCGLPRSAHPEPEPAPRPTIAELEAILRSDKPRRIEIQPNGEIRAVPAEPAPPREPEERGYRPMEREELDPLGGLAETLVLQPCPHNLDSKLCMGDCVRCARALLERVVRECAEASAQEPDCYVDCYDAVLHRWGLSESEESK